MDLRYFNRDKETVEAPKTLEAPKQSHKFGQFKLPTDCHIKGLAGIEIPEEFGDRHEYNYYKKWSRPQT